MRKAVKKKNQTTDIDPVAPEANLKFIGNPPRYSITTFTDGNKDFELPADQSSPFYHAEARRIVQLFPLHYELLGSERTGCCGG